MKQTIKWMCVLLCCTGILVGCQASNDPTIAIIQQRDASMEKGDKAFAAADYEQAVTNYTEAIATDSKYDVAYINRARSYLKLKQVQKADADLQTVVALQQPNISAAYYDVKTELWLQKRVYPQALDTIQRAIQLEQTDDRLVSRGHIFYLLHQTQQAKQDLVPFLDQPEYQTVDFYYTLSEIAIYEGEYDAALTYIARMATFDSSAARADAMLAYVQLKKVPMITEREARQAVLEAIEQHRNKALSSPECTTDTVLQNYLGLTYYLEDDFIKALPLFDQAIEGNPQEATFYNNRALLYYESGDTESAYRDLSKAIDLDKLEPEFFLGRGYVLMTRDQEASAIGDFTQAVSLNPTYLDRVPDTVRTQVEQAMEEDKQ